MRRRFRMPAVSIRLYCCRTPSVSTSNGTSIASRVVPEISLTITRCDSVSALMIDDLPTLGRPTMAMFIGGSASAWSSSSPDSTGLAKGLGNRPTAWPSGVSTPRSCSALTGNMCSKPSSENSSTPLSCPTVSTLLMINKTGLPASRSIPATSRSIGTMPSCTLTTNKITSTSSSATCTCVTISCAKSSPPCSPFSRPMPPVSTSMNGRPCHSTSALSRSRVTPGRSCTIAIRLRAIRLKRADFPTLGRPTMATTPDTPVVVTGLMNRCEAGF